MYPWDVYEKPIASLTQWLSDNQYEYITRNEEEQLNLSQIK